MVWDEANSRTFIRATYDAVCNDELDVDLFEDFVQNHFIYLNDTEQEHIKKASAYRQSIYMNFVTFMNNLITISPYLLYATPAQLTSVSQRLNRIDLNCRALKQDMDKVARLYAAAAKNPEIRKGDTIELFGTAISTDNVMELMTQSYGNDVEADARKHLFKAYTKAHPVLIQKATTIKDITWELNRAGYKHPLITEQPYAANFITKHNDDIDAFELVYSDAIPVSSPTLLDIACFYGSKRIATFLMTTKLAGPVSHPLYWLALGKKFALAKTLILNNKVISTLDKNWLASTPPNAPSILDIFTHYNDKPFIKTCVESGIPLKEADRQAKIVTSAELLKEQGNKLYTSNQFDKAVECYTNAIDIIPSHILYTNRSVAYYRLGKLQESLQDATESIKIDPKWTKAYLRKAMALKDLGRTQEAFQACTEGLDITPSYIELSEYELS
eukprot:gene18255-21845_t